MVRYLTVYLFDSKAEYESYLHYHDGSLENAPASTRLTGTQDRDLYQFNDYADTLDDLKEELGHLMALPMETKEQFIQISLLAAIVVECIETDSHFVVIVNR